MPESLEDLLARPRQERTLFLSGEEATRQGAILPILARLGWDRDNVREVVPEFSVGNGRVDYCLKVGEKETVFIEVKRTNEELERHQEQLLEYAFRDGVELAVLTNGILWWLYLPLLEGSWDQRRFFAIDIQQQQVEEAAQHFRDFLSRDTVANGLAGRRAREVHAGREKDRLIRQTLPKAWGQLCQEPDETLLELIADRVESLCGHRPDHELIAEHLAEVTRYGGTGSEAAILPTVTRPSRERSPRRGDVQKSTDTDWTSKRVVGYIFKGTRHPVSTFKEILIGLCEALHRVHRADFSRILTLRGRKRIYFSQDFKGMTHPREIPGSGFYAETNLSANSIRDRCKDLLALFGQTPEDLQIEMGD